MQTQALLTLTQLLERFRGFNSIAPNTNFINFRPTQLIQYIATLEAIEGDMELALADIERKQHALNFALQNCPTCSKKGGTPDLCPICLVVQAAGGDYYAGNR